jgi:hypothetical protein
MTRPQLVVQEMAGRHNADLEGTSARLIRNGSWKKQRIVRIIPAGDSIPAKVVLSWLHLGFPPNNGVHTVLAMGMEIGDAYTSAIESILAHPELSQWEYVCSIEHDNMPPSDGIIQLVEAMETHPEFAAISGSYFTKGEGGVWQGWGDPRDPLNNFRPQVPVTGTVQEVCGLGQGFCLYRLGMFKDTRLRRPWFKTLKGKDGLATQDLYFWTDARKYGYRCAVCVDCKVGHYDLKGEFGPPDMVW